MRKILFAVPRYHTNMLGWIVFLKKHKFDITILSNIKGQSENHDLIEPIFLSESLVSKLIRKIFGDGGPNKLRAFSQFSKLHSMIRSKNFSIVIVRDIQRWLSIQLLLLSPFYDFKLIIYSQTEKFAERRLRNFLISLICIIFRAEWITPLKGDTAIRSSSNKLHFFPFCIPNQEHQDKRLSNPISLITVGKFLERKNFIHLIKTLSSLSNDYDFSLTICGEISNSFHKKYFKYVLEQSNKFFTKDKINFEINLSHDQVQEKLRNSNIFILPSYNEPASIAPLEAMAAGLPVIITNSSGTKEYISRSGAGIVVAPHDEGQLLDAIKIIISNYDQYSASSYKGHEEQCSERFLKQEIQQNKTLSKIFLYDQ
jgi:glycosyltransferase involved in cell wall biosynthesis